MLFPSALTVLNTPLLVDMVMALLHNDKRTLWVCTQVSELWAYVAIPFFWDEVNAHEVVHTLIRSTDLDRRQQCIQQIRNLDFSLPRSRAFVKAVVLYISSSSDLNFQNSAS